MYFFFFFLILSFTPILVKIVLFPKTPFHNFQANWSNTYSPTTFINIMLIFFLIIHTNKNDENEK